VVIGVADDFAGALAPERLNNLAPLWKQIADVQNLQLVSVKTHMTKKNILCLLSSKNIWSIYSFRQNKT